METIEIPKALFDELCAFFEEALTVISDEEIDSHMMKEKPLRDRLREFKGDQTAEN